MKHLFLMRHAKSSWRDDSLSDFERPLKRRGQRAALRMGEHLTSQQLIPELIVSSNATRAQATADLLVGQLPGSSELELCEELYHASPNTIVSVIQRTNDQFDSMMIVGHNPGLEELVFQWTREFLEVTTAAIIHFVLGIDHWSKLKLKDSRSYQHFWKPKELESKTDDLARFEEN